MANMNEPVLSVIAAIVSDTIGVRASAGHLRKTLEALSNQTDAPSMEVIVPHHLWVDGIEDVKREFPSVRFVPVPEIRPRREGETGREHHDILRSRGITASRGELIAMLEDHGVPARDWARKVVEAHRQPYAAVGGAMENGISQTLNWAVYFCDFGKYQNPIPAGESFMASDANVSYKRAALEAVRDVWQPAYQETRVHAAMMQRGLKLALSPEIVVHQHRTGLEFGRALDERRVWGRSYAATRLKLVTPGKRLFLMALCPLLPVLIVGRMALGVLQKGRLIGAFLQSAPAIAVLSCSWSLGELQGYLTGETDGPAESSAVSAA